MKKTILSTALTLAMIMPFSTQSQAQRYDDAWTEIKQKNLLYLEFETGLVTVQLAEFFAPNHTQHIRELVNAGHYDGIFLYRVVENFVVQGGPDEDTNNDPLISKTIKHEAVRDIDKTAKFYEYESDDLYAEQVGFINSFPVGRSITEGKEWLIHCNGTVNMARGNDNDSGTSSFAMMFGGYQRYLDRNSTVFGRIIDGWDAFYKVNRGVANNKQERENISSKVLKAYLGSSLPKYKQKTTYVENSNNKAFDQTVMARKAMENEWFTHKQNGNYNICLRNPTIKIVD